MDWPQPSLREGGVTRRFRWALWPVLGLLALTLLPWLLYTAWLEYRCAPIQHVRGTVGLGPPPIYHELAYTNRYPRWVGALCRTRLGEWYFRQFPVVYSVDLRRVYQSASVEKGLTAAATFRNLRRLTLYESAVRDDQLARLPEAFPALTHLSINETKITDDGIRHLRGHPALEYVNAQRTRITDAAIADLATLPRLKELAIAETQITTVEAIRARHPQCRIRGVLNVAERCKLCRQLLGDCRCPERQRRGWSPPVLNAAGLEPNPGE